MPLGKLGRRLDYDIKMDFTERSYSNMDGTDFAHDIVLWQILVSAVLILPDLLS
jgi:hypothetical protein